MGDSNKNRNRRDFLSLFFPGEKKTTDPEMVKMLTPDGKLVEVKKSIISKASDGRKVSNAEILNWMQNPSKENT